jgi:uncharacterized protein YbbC (DUF1343 family)
LIKVAFDLKTTHPARLLLFLFLLWGIRGTLAIGVDNTPMRVLNGIDVLRRANFAPLAGKRVGLITNQTGLAVDGETTIDLLHNSKICELVALFSPEHGIRGIGEGSIASSVDNATGLPVYSLYGESKRPTPEMLRDLDALVFDMQDVGARFYTYATTMAYCMEEAAKNRISFFVLDRPNPIGGRMVGGPILDADRVSFTGYMPLPVRHGMTIGELAKYFNAEKHIGVDLQVIPMEGWQRNYLFTDTGQVWVDPSPNIRSLTAELFYPGVCLLEGTNVSVGRGTDRPFEIVGAPWIEPRQFAAALNATQATGVRFIPLYFTPKTDTHRGVKCGGAALIPHNLNDVDSVLLGLTLISVLHRLYPREFEIDQALRLLGNYRALADLKAGNAPTEVLRSGDSQLSDFLKMRKRVLIYGDALDSKEGKNEPDSSAEKERRN